MRPEPGEGLAAAARTAPEVGLELAHESAQRPPELDRSPDRVTVPERQLARLARRRRHDHPVVPDVLDPPAARAEGDDLAGPALVDHLLVELADPPAGRPGLADHEHAVQAPIGNRPARGHGDDARVAPAIDRVRDPVPHESGLQLRELVRRVRPGEHPEHALEDLPRQGLVRCRAGDGREQLVHGPAIEHGHGHDLLGQHVERIARQGRRLDRAVVHPARDDGRLEQVAPELREDDAGGRRVDLVAGPTDPLEARRDRRGRLDLDDEVDGAHVDPELERARGDDRRQPAGLQVLLDREPLLPGDRAVMSPDELLAGQLVQALGEPFGQAARVAEHDRAVVAPDQVEDPGMDRRPDAGPRLRTRGGSAGLLVQRQRLAEPAHVLDRHDDRQLEPLAGPGVDDLDRPARARAAEEPRDRLERTLGRRQPDPLERRRVVGAEPLEPLEAEREVRPSLRPGDGVDLVDDHLLDAAQDVARRARQQQVQRLGRRDQDVRRAAGDLATILGRRVAGPGGDRDVRHGQAEPLRGQRDPGQGRPQVPLDVVGQGLERADVQDPDRARRRPGRHRPRRSGGQTIEAPEERGEGLAAPGRGVDERVPAGRDRGPATRLRVRRRLERALEPGPDRRPEARQRIGRAARRRPVVAGSTGSGGGGRGHGSERIRPPATTDQTFCLTGFVSPG